MKEQEPLSFKVTDKNEDTPVAEIKSIKASERTRSHLTGAGANNRTFESAEDMIKSAESLYANANQEEYNNDVRNGLDINNIDSVKNFKTGYTPTGHSILVKYIKEDQKIGSIFIPNGATGTAIKAVVITPGLFVNHYKTGDVIVLRGQTSNNPIPPSENRVFKNITFKEISSESVAGCFIEREELIKRIGEENRLLGRD